MRGDDNQQGGMFSYISPEKRVPTDHPLRPMRKMVDEVLRCLGHKGLHQKPVAVFQERQVQARRPAQDRLALGDALS